MKQCSHIFFIWRFLNACCKFDSLDSLRKFAKEHHDFNAFRMIQIEHYWVKCDIRVFKDILDLIKNS